MVKKPTELDDTLDTYLAEAIRTRESIAAALAGLDAQISHLRRAKQTRNAGVEHILPLARGSTNDSANITRRYSVRNDALEALGDFGWCLYSRQVAQYTQAKAARRITPERFGVLANDEKDAFDRGTRPRPVWLCHGLTHDWHLPIKRLWARSDWPLERRIVGPDTPQVQHLKVTAKLCEFALRAEEFTEPDMICSIAAGHARGIDGIGRTRQGDERFEEWRDFALAQLEKIEPEDEAFRRESADRLRGRDELFLLFGMPERIEGDQDDRAAGRHFVLRLEH